jgi:hypothetical protein
VYRIKRIRRPGTTAIGPGWHPPKAFRVTGTIPAGTFPFERSTWGTRSSAYHGAEYEFEGVHAESVDFDLDGISIDVRASRFHACRFHQTLGPIGPHTGVQGDLGRGNVGYEDCVFDRLDFGLRGGGYQISEATFTRCTFHYCRWRWLNATRADFIECTFIGAMRHAWFYGVDPDDPSKEVRFERNDFTRARLHGVEFRNRIDLTTTRFPAGDRYLKLDRFLSRLRAARQIVATWDAEERRDAERIIDIYEKEGVDILFASKDALPRPGSPLWPLLDRLGPGVG